MQTTKKKTHRHGAAEHSYDGLATIYLDDSYFGVVSMNTCLLRISFAMLQYMYDGAETQNAS